MSVDLLDMVCEERLTVSLLKRYSTNGYQILVLIKALKWHLNYLNCIIQMRKNVNFIRFPTNF